jgi:tRNA-splicing ligase RtcB
MKREITTEKIPIKLWLDDIEERALEQARNLANHPFAYHHIAVMPDAHVGYGMPIGGVLATRDVVIANAVGVDIGCGLCAVKTSLNEIDKETLKRILGKIRETIPVGFGRHKKKQDQKLMPENWQDLPVVKREFKSALTQIGTLGGGNHFIEVQKGSDEHVWIMIHSGSRNIGLQVATYYNRLAQKLNEKYEKSVPRAWQLSFLPLDTDEGQTYMKEMQYCVDFALTNRKLMTQRILNVFNDLFPDFSHDEVINIAHNYARLENHFGKDVIVHRKGATLATTATTGIVPGSQGAPSYIVKGLGNRDSFQTCAHGAGRKMGRRQARDRLNLEDEIKKLDLSGVIHSIRGRQDLDEAPSVYKDISEVMKNQEDLVKPLIKLQPLAVVKG